ncbi:threonine-phosphate decarboxylase CobD [Aerolutibacter ruishenii]|uniref:threonine-phosphate decarboxylase n=1 Tax=Aerolutibacter ruishenii TaxID=686800 RepID=A0A562M2V0_9GAMM|nr:threonine-phosphate decarboxylase CobD [Lysobacter ruishenii]TWI14142.1 L-threonine O-3-phosphate decarboxylase [Lysobacter ruishenii]
MLEHGGRLLRAARHYGIAPDHWLDLSTGVNPEAWPVPPIPARAWHRLPEDDDGLVEAAMRYYRAPHVLPVAGSQAAIQALPLLRPHSRVGVLAPGYAEHAHAWERAGHRVERLSADALLDEHARLDVVVLIHPNNPGGDVFDRSALLRLHERLHARGAWLVVDEAFMDATPDDSLCADSGGEGLVVMRSVGKFFGLAGARAGFVCAAPALLQSLRERLGPWTLAGPARHAVQQALADRDWQAGARARLRQRTAQLDAILRANGLSPTGGTAFFQWCRDARAAELHDALARRAILVRLFEHPASLRFGLPLHEADFQRLDHALAEVSR